MQRAIQIGHYLLAHARKTFAEMGCDPAVEDARHVLAWIRKHGEDAFSRRTCFDALRSRFPRVELLEPALDLLERHGYIRERPLITRGGRGRPPGPVYDVNPATLKGAVPPSPSPLSLAELAYLTEPATPSPGTASTHLPEGDSPEDEILVNTNSASVITPDAHSAPENLNIADSAIYAQMSVTAPGTGLDEIPSTATGSDGPPAALEQDFADSAISAQPLAGASEAVASPQGTEAAITPPTEGMMPVGTTTLPHGCTSPDTPEADPVTGAMSAPECSAPEATPGPDAAAEDDPESPTHDDVPTEYEEGLL
jgi:hypothetical protein